MNAPRRVALVLPMAALLGGCGSTVVHSGLPPGEAPRGYDERWHAAFLFGAISFSESYDLAVLCPNGWSEIQLSSDEFTFAASLFTAFLYTPSRLTILCAAPRSPHPPAIGSYPSPRRGRAIPPAHAGDNVAAP